MPQLLHNPQALPSHPITLASERYKMYRNMHISQEHWHRTVVDMSREQESWRISQMDAAYTLSYGIPIKVWHDADEKLPV